MLLALTLEDGLLLSLVVLDDVCRILGSNLSHFLVHLLLILYFLCLLTITLLLAK